MNLTKAQLDEFRLKLEAEKMKIEAELSSVGEKDPHDPEDWVPKVPEYGGSETDPVDVADKIEEMGERVGIETALEERLDRIKEAVAAIEAGIYGTCNVGGEAHEIPLGRLQANPAATTCIKHADVH